MTRKDHIVINGVNYDNNIIYKRIKNIHFRFKNGAFEVTCHYFTSLKTIRDFLAQKGASLIESKNRTLPITEDRVYIFGKMYELSSPIIDENFLINFTDKESLLKQLKLLLKDYINERLKYYFDVMGITGSYKVRIKENSRVLGSNSSHTMSLSFTSSLVHYSKEIIDSVIVHECAHHFIRNHSDEFYDIVYKYFPNYNLCRKKLIHSIFA